MKYSPLFASLALAAIFLLMPTTLHAQSNGLYDAPHLKAPSATAKAAAANEAFALTNAAGDTLFVVDESGAVITGSPGGFIGSAEGFVSNMTRPGGPSAGMFITNNPANQGVNLYARTNGTGIAGYFAQVNDTTRSAAVLAQTISMGAAGGFEIYNTQNDYSAVFGLTRGLGPSGNFNIENEANNTSAVIGVTDGTGEAGFFRRSGNGSDYGPAVQVLQEGTAGFAPAIHAHITNSENGSPALRSETRGVGYAADFRVSNAESSGTVLMARQRGMGHGGFFQVDNPGNSRIALIGQTLGVGPAAAVVRAGNGGNYGPALQVHQEGTSNNFGPAIHAQLTSSENGSPVIVAETNGTGDIAHFSADGDLKMRIGRDGNVYADGTFNGGGADLAEAFDVEGAAVNYAPGDVLVISTRTDRTVERSQKPYSTLVAGVYATKPGVLLSEKGLATDMSARVPVGVVGVLPTNVILEGGPIRRGDLLVTSSTPGAAMRADLDRVRVGQVLGKALEDYDGTGPARIKVLVSVQ